MISAEVEQDRTARDSGLVARWVRTRDEHAFAALYDEHSPKLYRLAMLWLNGVRCDADDVLQETWSRAARALDSWRADARLSTWLAGILMHCVQEQRRRGMHAVPIDDEFLAPFSEALGESLGSMLRALPPGCAEILVLHELVGYTHDEIAALKSISAGTSKSQLSRARQLLQQRHKRGEVQHGT